MRRRPTRRRVTRKTVREVDRVQGRGVLERREKKPIETTYDFRIFQQFLDGELPGLFEVRNGTIVLDESDSSLVALMADNESCTLVMTGGLSLKISIMGGDALEGNTWNVMIMGNSIKELLKERGLTQ